MRGCLRMAFAQYVKWLCAPRMLIFLILVVYAKEIVGNELCAHAAKVGEKLHFFEPYIALSNSYIVVLITPVVFLLLMSNFPIMEGSYMWSVYRMGKNKWIFSQFILALITKQQIL